MSGSVFVETLRRNLRGLVLWGAGIASMALYIILVIPGADKLKQYTDLMKGLPSFLINAMGGDAASIGTPGGFLAYGFFGWIMLVFATYAVLAGLNITANEEDRGIMDVLLSLPLPRWRVILEKFLAYALIMTGMVAMSFIVLWIGISRSDALGSITTGQLLQSSFNFIPATLTVLAFTAFVATLVRRRSTAAAISAVFVVGSWFVDTIARTAGGGEILSKLSFFSLYDSSGVMKNGLTLSSVLILMLAVALLLGGSVWAFARRDVGV